MNTPHPPEILAPAGNKDSFLAAIAAGADAIYVGLKEFSAREQAPNFNIPELIPLMELARKKGKRVYLALNVLIFESELKKLQSLLKIISTHLSPHALIVQDMAIISMLREIQYSGEIHLSTLGAWQITSSIDLIEKMGINRIVLPRELTIDEIQQVSRACNSTKVALEVFVHGALCYGISGRCYWSSMLGGKSGLRGRCVQPCRRIYETQGKRGRFFSCKDLSVDVLTKILLKVPKVVCWKIEGRKKGPHYVFYTTKAYSLLRDHPEEARIRKEALKLLKMCLGRPCTHYNILSHRRYCPVEGDEERGSGLVVAKVGREKTRAFIRPYLDLLPGDVLRVGYQDKKGHMVLKIRTYVRRGKRYPLPTKTSPLPGTKVFLVDRREQGLLQILKELDKELFYIGKKAKPIPAFPSSTPPTRGHGRKKRDFPFTYLQISPPGREKGKARKGIERGVWIEIGRGLGEVKRLGNKWLWLPPMVWPEEEHLLQSLVSRAIKYGARKFILNSIYHISLFKGQEGLHLWAGPFMNISNSRAISTISPLGFKGVILSPELCKEEVVSIARSSPLEVGMVIKGMWPFCVSRTKREDLEEEKLILSPKGEGMWIKRYGENFFIFPNWEIDLSSKIPLLKRAGVSLFVEILIPTRVPLKKRKYTFNF